MDSELRHFSTILLRLHRGEITQRRMPPMGIIKPDDIFKYILLGLRFGAVILKVHPCALEGAEEALNRCVVIAIAGLTHADFKVVILQELADLVTGVLAAAVGVM